jgi:Mg-chelatase subunit ChlD
MSGCIQLRTLAWLSGLLVMAACISSAQAQPANERVLIERVSQAEGAVRRAELALTQAHRDGDADIARHQDAIERRDALSGEIRSLIAEVTALRDQAERTPVVLTSQESALYDVLTRLIQRGAPADEIRARERQLAEVQARIAAFEASQGPANIRLRSLSGRLEALQAQRSEIDREITSLESPAFLARTGIEAAADALARARGELARTRALARFELNDDAPPFLQRVVVRAGNDTPYEAGWIEPAREVEELLRLAEYLHADLGRTIAVRRRNVDHWIAAVTEDQAAANAALANYAGLMGGSSDGILGYVERGLDAVSFGYAGAIVTAGSLTWRKIGIEVADAALTVGRDVYGGVPLHAALLAETIAQLAASLSRSGPANQGWDLESMPFASQAVQASTAPVTPADEQAMIASITAARLRAALEQMRGQVSAELQGEDFLQSLPARHGELTLAAAFSEAAFFGSVPDLGISERALLGQPLHLWAFAQLTQGTSVMKTLLKEAAFNDRANRRNVRAVFLDTLQSAVRDGLLERLEVERLTAWNAYLEADLEVQISVASLRNESRIRRLDERARTVLGAEIIPALTRELESMRETRRLEVTRDAAITGRRAEIQLVFTRPVRVEEVRIGDRVLESAGSDERWSVRFSPSDFSHGAAVLSVTARHAALEERGLDNPSTVASWSSLDRRFNNYEPGPDRHHSLRLSVPSGTAYAIVLDTSGSMEEQGRMVRAQEAVLSLFDTGRITADDQIALFTFSGCSVTQAVAFPGSADLARSAVMAAVANGATPLAESIAVAADSLQPLNVDHAVLVVVTDGSDTCEGAVGDALNRARRQTDAIRMRSVQ